MQAVVMCAAGVLEAEGMDVSVCVCCKQCCNRGHQTGLKSKQKVATRRQCGASDLINQQQLAAIANTQDQPTEFQHTQGRPKHISRLLYQLQREKLSCGRHETTDIKLLLFCRTSFCRLTQCAAHNAAVRQQPPLELE